MVSYVFVFNFQNTLYYRTELLQKLCSFFENTISICDQLYFTFFNNKRNKYFILTHITYYIFLLH